MSGRNQILTDGEFETIHANTLRILEEMGIAFQDEEALDFFRKNGAEVEGQVVRMKPELVERHLANVPATFRMVGRDESKAVTLGGRDLVLTPGLGSPFILDENGKREALLEDYRNFCKLVQTSDVLDMTGNIMCEPSDVPHEKSHMYQMLSNLTLTDKPCLGSGVSRRAAIDSWNMAKIAWGGEDNLKDKAVILAVISSLSPLQYSDEMAGSLVEYAKNGQPVMVGGLIMAGSTGPVRMAGTVTLQNAEFLAGIILAQMINPGNPCIYGGTTAVTDMRSGGLSIGSPEMMVVQNLQAQIAARYNMPCRGSGGISDAFTLDYQAGVESALALLTTIRSGSHFILHSVGIMGAYLAMSYEKFIADEEVCAMIRRILAPVEFNEETIDLETIREVGVGGEYLTHMSTFKHCRTEFYNAQVMQRGYYSTWESNGSRRVEEVARDRVAQRLAAYEKPAMDPAVEKALNDYVENA